MFSQYLLFRYRAIASAWTCSSPIGRPRASLALSVPPHTHDDEEFNGMFGWSVTECWLRRECRWNAGSVPGLLPIGGKLLDDLNVGVVYTSQNGEPPAKVDVLPFLKEIGCAVRAHDTHGTHDTHNTHDTHDLLAHTHTYTQTENRGDSPERLPERPGLRRRRRRGPLAHPRPASHPTAPRYLWYPPTTRTHAHTHTP